MVTGREIPVRRPFSSSGPVLQCCEREIELAPTGPEDRTRLQGAR